MNKLIALLALLAGPVLAAPGHWYNPDNDGVGLQIDQNLHGFGHQVTWYLYRRDGSSAFLVGNETCAEFPCVLEMVEPTAGWMGGALELGDPVGSLEIGVADEDGLTIQYDLRSWVPEYCTDIGPGGVIFRKCAGWIDLILLTD